MPDVMTSDQRKKAMRANRGRTKPERALASLLWQKGLRYLTAEGYREKSGETMPGHPDMIFSSRRVIVFVDGCFWHGCPECKRVPPDMTPFWLEKIRTNMERDRRITSDLTKRGWRVVRIWEHSIKTKTSLSAQAEGLASSIRTA